MPVTETVSNPWLGFYFNSANAARNARKAAMSHDPVNAALWALSGFDTTCGRFADLREDLASRHPDPHEPLRQSIDVALCSYANEQSSQLRLVGGYSEQQIDDIANNLLQRQHINKAAMQALACGSRANTYHAMVALTQYAITLAAAGNFGPAPFRRFADMMEECYRQLYKTNFKGDLEPDA